MRKLHPMSFLNILISQTTPKGLCFLICNTHVFHFTNTTLFIHSVAFFILFSPLSLLILSPPSPPYVFLHLRDPNPSFATTTFCFSLSPPSTISLCITIDLPTQAHGLRISPSPSNNAATKIDN